MKHIILNGTSRDFTGLQVTSSDSEGLRGTARDFERPQETRETQGGKYGIRNSGSFRKPLESSEVFRSFWKFSEVFRSFRKFSEVVRSFQKFSVVFGSFRKFLEICWSMLEMMSSIAIFPVRMLIYTYNNNYKRINWESDLMRSSAFREISFRLQVSPTQKNFRGGFCFPRWLLLSRLAYWP